MCVRVRVQVSVCMRECMCLIASACMTETRVLLLGSRFALTAAIVVSLEVEVPGSSGLQLG